MNLNLFTEGADNESETPLPRGTFGAFLAQISGGNPQFFARALSDARILGFTDLACGF